MTREEAHKILSNGLVNAPSEHEWCVAFALAIKVLRQEPVLDKIRAEINNIHLTDTDGHSGNWYREPQAIINDALRIIDRHRAESEGK